MENFELISFASDQALIQAVGDAWLTEIATANSADNQYYVALSGGRIARTFFISVAEQAKGRAISFERVHFFWADERCVPPDDAECNFLLAHEHLFMPLQIADDHIHRIPGEKPTDIACAEAEAEICRIAPLDENGQPILDLILLGMGEDGHVASLFPGESEIVASDKTVYRAIHDSPKPPLCRVTIGYTTIAAAKQVWVLAAGAGKEVALTESLKSFGRTPLARVLQSRSHTRVFTDFQAC